MVSPFDLIWPALAVVPGVLDRAIVHLAGGDVGVNVAFTEPDQSVFDGVVQARQYRIEYLTNYLASIPRGTIIEINSKAYKTSAPPRIKGDGLFSLVDMELI